MKKIYLIEHWQKGFWSEERQKFGGILFATRYAFDWEVEKAISKMKSKGPVFMKIGWEQ